MADREVNVRVNIVPGSDRLTPAAQAQTQAIRRMQEEARAQGVPQATPAQAMRQAAATGAEAASPASPAAQAADVLARLRPSAPPAIPPGAIRITAPEGGQGGAGMAAALRGVLGGIGGLAGGGPGAALGGGMGALGGGLGGIIGAFGPMAGIFGAAAAAAGPLARAIENIRLGFTGLPPVLSEITQRMSELRDAARDIRGQGSPTAATFRQVFEGTSVVRQLRAAEGNPAQQRNVLQQARNQAEQDVQNAAAQNPQEAADEMSELLRRQREEYRLRPGAPGQILQFQTERRELLRRRNINPNQMPVEFMSNLNMNDQQIRQMADVPMQRFQNATARREAADAALREGRAPDLRPGAIDLRELPNLFQSRQTDVGDIHAQIQQEAVRDQRQEAQFQAQMALWERILGQIEEQNGRPAPPPRDRD